MRNTFIFIEFQFFIYSFSHKNDLNLKKIKKKRAFTGRLTDVKQRVRTSYMHKRQDYDRN